MLVRAYQFVRMTNDNGIAASIVRKEDGEVREHGKDDVEDVRELVPVTRSETLNAILPLCDEPQKNMTLTSLH